MLPSSLTFCCDATVTFASSAARQFFPYQFQTGDIVVGMANGSGAFPNWRDPRIYWTHDTTLLSWALPRDGNSLTWTALSVVYNAPINTRITVFFTQYGFTVSGSVSVTIVDVRNLSVTLSANPLHRIHCSQAFERAQINVSAFIDLYGYIMVDFGWTAAVTKSSIAHVEWPFVVPDSPGSTGITVVWWGYTGRYDTLVILENSTVFASIGSPDYVFNGVVGQSIPLNVTLNPPNPLMDLWSILIIQVPPSVQVNSRNLISIANSLQEEQIVFTLPQCNNQSSISASAKVLVNLAPASYDVDLGKLDGLALQASAGTPCLICGACALVSP